MVKRENEGENREKFFLCFPPRSFRFRLSRLSPPDPRSLILSLSFSPSRLKKTGKKKSHEQGEYFAIDIGGTNYRVTYARLSAETGKLAALEMRDSSIPDWAYTAPAPRLFDLLAEAVVSLGRDLGVLPPSTSTAPAAAAATAEAPSSPQGEGARERENKSLTVGFCFSFPCDQTALDAGRLLKLTKRFQNEGAVGRDPVEMLRAALARAGEPGARVAALLNDSVGTLAGGRYSDPAVAVGVILGTGTNAAYVEAAANVPKLPKESALRLRGGRVVVNTEWGNFNAPSLPTLEADLALDAASEHPGEQLLEKMVSGMYMGECARRLLLELVERHSLFSSSSPTSPPSSASIPEGLKAAGSFSTADVSACDTDSSLTLSKVAAVLSKVLGADDAASRVSYLDRRAVRAVCSLVAARSARLLAAAVASLLQLVEDAGESVSGVPRGGRVAVAVDGGVFEHYAKYRSTCRAALAEALGVPLRKVDSRVALRRVRDASSLGAAFLAAAADHHHLGTSADVAAGAGAAAEAEAEAPLPAPAPA